MIARLPPNVYIGTCIGVFCFWYVSVTFKFLLKGGMKVEILKEMKNVDDFQKDKYLMFTIDKEVYGIEIKYVTEIVGIQEITQVPELPKFVKGIINLRGKIIPVVDVRIRFSKTEKDYDERTCIIVVDIEETLVGLIVDNVVEVLSLSQENIVNQQGQRSNFQSRYIKGIGKVGNNIKLLLDVGKLLNEGEMDELEKFEV